MSTDQKTGEQATNNERLSEDVVESSTVQSQGGSLLVTFPIDSARELGISKGDTVLFLGERGGVSLEVGRSDRILQE